MKNKDKNSSGLTLVEVLLSIIILSIGVSTLMLATNRCLTVIKRAQNRDIAQNLIRQINTDHPIVKIDLDEKIENGDFEKFENFFGSEKFYLLIRKHTRVILDKSYYFMVRKGKE